MAKHEFTVTFPIAGHACITVEAESKEEAIDLARDSITSEHLETWETLDKVNSGNVCHFPSPWEVDVQDEGPVDDMPNQQ